MLTALVTVATATPVALVCSIAAAHADVPAGWLAGQTLQPYRDYSDSSEYQVMSFTAPDGEATALWSDGANTLLSADRARNATSWSAPVAVATDGEFVWQFIEGSEPVAAMAPNGDLVVAWPDLRFDRIETATRHDGLWSAPLTIASGNQLSDVHLAIGTDGTQALVWTDDGAHVYASILAPQAASWSAPAVVSDPVVVPAGDATPYPLLRDPRVAVATTGAVTVSWGAFNGLVNTDSQKIYRVRATTLPAGAGAWTAPGWVSLPGELVNQPELVAGADGSLQEFWLADDGITWSRLRSARLTEDGWSTPNELGTRTEQVPQVTATPDGTLTAAWMGYTASGGAEVRSARYTTASGWSPVSVLNAGDEQLPNQVSLVATADGTPTATWQACTIVNATTSCMLEMSTLTDGSWSAPVYSAAVDPGLARYAVSSSPDGLLNVVYDDGVANPDNLHGRYQVTATGTTLPPLVTTARSVITGTPTVGTPLTASTGTWQPAPGTYSYQWWRNGIAMPGAVETTYTPALADGGSVLTFTVTAHRDGYLDETTRSGAVEVPVPSLVATATPVITGTPAVGTPLTASTGTWQPAPGTYGYQWERDGNAIGDGSGATYIPSLADVGHQLSVTVTARRDGYLSQSARSTAVSVPQPAVHNLTTPAITGAVRIGSALTASTGGWQPTPGSYRYQWWRNGVAVPTAAQPTYTPGLADAGCQLTVTVTAHLAGYLDQSARSAGVSIPRPAIHNLVRPTITGTARVGYVLVGHAGSWTPAPSGYRYQWLRDGRPIPAAARYAYRIGTADRGHAISFEVVASRTSYLSAIGISWPVRPR